MRQLDGALTSICYQTTALTRGRSIRESLPEGQRGLIPNPEPFTYRIHKNGHCLAWGTREGEDVDLAWQVSRGPWNEEESIWLFQKSQVVAARKLDNVPT